MPTSTRAALYIYYSADPGSIGSTVPLTQYYGSHNERDSPHLSCIMYTMDTRRRPTMIAASAAIVQSKMVSITPYLLKIPKPSSLSVVSLPPSDGTQLPSSSRSIYISLSLTSRPFTTFNCVLSKAHSLLQLPLRLL